MCTNRFVYTTGPGEVCLSAPQQEPSNKTHTQMQKNLWGQFFLMKVQQLVTVTGQEVTTMWAGLKLGTCHKVQVHGLTEREKRGVNVPSLAF